MGTDPDNITQPVQPEYRAYQYDPIGNRAQITEAANTGAFTANNLNQYTGQTVPGDGTRSFDYDADGNLISLIENGSEKVYTWNAENRLTSVAPRTPANGDKKVEFIYDYMGRRVKKSVYSYSSDSWLLTSEFFFVYDGWNLVEEITEAGADQTSRYFVWGQDLSQSLQGAGGIGGLIATVDGAADYLYCFDANGNVGQVVNAADGAIAAKYEYDPYGKPIKADGAYAGDNPFRFSTKYHDDETGLVYYGYRYYSPELGRWLNRDPVEERGGINLYVFVKNNVLNLIDKLGQASTSSCMYCGPDVTGELAKELNNAKERWKRDYSKYFDNIIEFTYYWNVHRFIAMYTIGPTLDFLAKDYAIKKNGKNCPSGKECERSYEICGTCVHDHFMGNIMYGFWIELFDILKPVAYLGGHFAQFVGPSDDSSFKGALQADHEYDQAGYRLGFALGESMDKFDSTKFDNTKVCDSIKKLSDFDSANNTGKDLTKCELCR